MRTHGILMNVSTDSSRDSRTPARRRLLVALSAALVLAGAGMATAADAKGAAAAPPGRHEKTYVGGAGEEGPWGRDCGRGEPELGQPDISQGGACFHLAPGATSVTVTVTDRVSPHVMAQVLFLRHREGLGAENDEPLGYQFFCDTIHFASAPRGADAMDVSLLEVLEVREIVPGIGMPCTNATPGTTGTVTATF